MSKLRVPAFNFLLILTAVAVPLAAFDFCLSRYMEKSGVLAESIDIRSESALYAKLMYLKEWDGIKMALIGDSVVVGQDMKVHGDREWHQHTLSALLEQNLKPEDKAVVVNVGVNGARMADFKELVDFILTARPQLLLLEVHVSSFDSGPAKNGDKTFGRPWIQEMSEGGDKPWTLRLDAGVESFLLEHWFAYRVRDFVQSRYMGGAPKALLQQSAESIEKRLQPPELPPLETNLAATKKEYDGIDLSEQSPQVEAFRAMLKVIQSLHQPTILFYVPENQAYLDKLIDHPRYLAFKKRLVEIASEYAAPNLQLELNIDALPPSDYIDTIHPNADGFRRLVTANLLPAAHRLGF